MIEIYGCFEYHYVVRRILFILLVLFVNTFQIRAEVPFQPARNLKEMNRMLDQLNLVDWSDVKGHGLYHLKIDFSADETEMIKRIGYKVPKSGILSLGIPEDLDSSRQLKFLFTSVTTDIYAPNAYSIRNYYRNLNQSDWIVVSVDADYWPKKDTVTWRLILFSAAYRQLKQHFPAFPSSQIAFAGYSGGSKLSVYLAYFCYKTGKLPYGLFLGGCNEVPFEQAADLSQIAVESINNVPVFFSNGKQDRIATVRSSQREARQLEQLGVQHIQSETHAFGHRLVGEHIRSALEFFDLAHGNPTQTNHENKVVN